MRRPRHEAGPVVGGAGSDGVDAVGPHDDRAAGDHVGADVGAGRRWRLAAGRGAGGRGAGTRLGHELGASTRAAASRGPHGHVVVIGGRGPLLGRREGRVLVVLVVGVMVHGVGRGARRPRGAAGAEHERVHAHADVAALALEALPHEHARASLGARAARLLTDAVTLAAVHGTQRRCSSGPIQQQHQRQQRRLPPPPHPRRGPA